MRLRTGSSHSRPRYCLYRSAPEGAATDEKQPVRFKRLYTVYNKINEKSLYKRTEITNNRWGAFTMQRTDEKHEYDVALSFAGEEREYVSQVATSLKNKGVKVFYDFFEEANLWGKNLYEYLNEIYGKKSKFTVMFISVAYAQKLWTTHERRAAQERAFRESSEYILPARFDDTEIPGILSTVHYLDLRSKQPEELAELIIEKLIKAGATVPSEKVRS